jgi:hypothetical protein
MRLGPSGKDETTFATTCHRYLGGEADELMFGHSVAGAGVGQDQYEVREVPDQLPNSITALPCVLPSCMRLPSLMTRRKLPRERSRCHGRSRVV